MENGEKAYEIALIIDDIGYDQNMAMALYELDPNISFLFFPGPRMAGPLPASLETKEHRSCCICPWSRSSFRM